MAKKFITKAIKRPGGLHKSLGVPQNKPIPPSRIRAAAKSQGRVGKQARFAQTLAKLRPKKGEL